jgi:hypothetical protein
MALRFAFWYTVFSDQCFLFSVCSLYKFVTLWNLKFKQALSLFICCFTHYWRQIVVGWVGWQNSHKLATLVGIVGKVPSRLQYVSHIHLIPLWHQQLTGPHLPNDIKVSQMALWQLLLNYANIDKPSDNKVLCSCRIPGHENNFNDCYEALIRTMLLVIL